MGRARKRWSAPWLHSLSSTTRAPSITIAHGVCRLYDMGSHTKPFSRLRSDMPLLNIPSCDVARSVRGERLQRVREGDHGVLRDESAAVKKQIALLSLGIIEGYGCVAHSRSQPSATERTLSALFGNLDGLRGVSSAFRAVTSSIVVAHRRNLGTLQLIEVRHDDARDRRVREHAAAPPPRRYRPEPGRGGRRQCFGCAGRACGDREHRRGRARARAYAALLTQLRAKVQLPLCLTIVSCLRRLDTLVLEQQYSRRAAAAATAKRLRPARPATRRAAAARRRGGGGTRRGGGGARRSGGGAQRGGSCNGRRAPPPRSRATAAARPPPRPRRRCSPHGSLAASRKLPELADGAALRSALEGVAVITQQPAPLFVVFVVVVVS